MFKLSSGFKSGLRVLTLLAESKPGQPVPISEMAPRLNLSDKYLEQLLMILRRAGLVRSIRGSNGGFLLAQSPAKITLRQILEALQGPIDLCECAREDCDECVRPEIWRAIETSFSSTLATLTLQHLISRDAFQLTPHSIVLPDAPLWQEGGGI
jgi:Rrf2 family cysteine metabolism transcriptional repressor